jgi:hypothetical protein
VDEPAGWSPYIAVKRGQGKKVTVYPSERWYIKGATNTPTILKLGGNDDPVQRYGICEE